MLVKTQRVCRSATVIEGRATSTPVVTLITVYDRMGKVSESKDTSKYMLGKITFKFQFLSAAHNRHSFRLFAYSKTAAHHI